MIEETGAFSIIDLYLRLAAAGRPIGYHDITGSLWLEIGNPARLEAARRAWLARD
jgi:NDP-sugar pyrophosphorylase family protein